MSKKTYTDEELIDILIKYNNGIRFPTQRAFVSKNNLPCYGTYISRFGSFKNAILMAGIKIPKSKQRYFDRESLSDNEMLSLLKYYTNKKLEKNIYLLTNEEIDSIKEIPSSSSYVSRFGGVIEAYKKINIDYFQYNSLALEKDMIKKHKNLANKLGHAPTSREINKYSQKGLTYSVSAISNHFGTFDNFQKKCDLDTNKPIGYTKSKEEMILDLQKLFKMLGRIPTVFDLKAYKWCAGQALYLKKFGSWDNALNIANLPHESKYCTTTNGTKCNSSYEYKLARVLEIHNIQFTKENMYKDYIKNFNKLYRFDFVLDFKDNKYFVEIFGITADSNYDIKIQEKIELCKKNNLKLLCFYPKDFWSNTYDNLYLLLLNKINNFN